MAAVATFDTAGLWLSTSVCEGAACPLAASLGVRWGRWTDEPDQAHAALDRSNVLGDLGRQLGAHVTDMVCLEGPDAADAHPRPQELVSEDAVVCVFLQGAALLCVRTPAGFTALLCEAGDWVHLPARVPHVFDAGESPDVAFMRLSAGQRGWFPLHTGASMPAELPAMDVFVERLLEALGEDIEGVKV